jgi:sec-independent protein translocase protein TatA
MGISVTQLLIILVIVIVLFGTKRLRNIGTDLGGAIKSFRSAVKEESDSDASLSAAEDDTIEGELTSKTKEKDEV